MQLTCPCGTLFKRSLRHPRCVLCPPCGRRASQARYRMQHPERVRRATAHHQRANRNQGRLKSLRWRAAHPDRAHQAVRRWQRSNKERLRAADRLRYEKRKAWEAAHPEIAADRALKRKQKMRRWYEQNRERASARARAWHAAHPEKVRETAKRWATRHPEETREHTTRRRARLRRVKIGVVNRAEVFARSGGRCAYCREPITPKSWHLDHVIPLARGGAHAMDNVVASCPPCNQRKSDSLNWAPSP